MRLQGRDLMKIMLIGKTGSGKTTLTQRLKELEVEYKKTQMVYYQDEIIDTPGEYIENKFFYKALNVTASSANVIGLVQASTDSVTYFPPNFASMFCGKKVIGIITKIDLEPDITKASKFLENAGVSEIICVGFQDDKSIIELRERLGIENEAKNSNS